MLRDRLYSAIERRINKYAYTRHFNPPVRFYEDGYQVNERIVELPFVYANLPMPGRGASVLDFGCTRSPLSLALASAGFSVTGVDLRPFFMQHPNFTFRQGRLQDLELEPFDYVVTVSVIEHVGLGAYAETADDAALTEVMVKLAQVLKPESGRMIVTTPCGMPSVDPFLRSFEPRSLLAMLGTVGLAAEKAVYFSRAAYRDWKVCDEAEIGEVSNQASDRGRTGVNGVGCFVLKRA